MRSSSSRRAWLPAAILLVLAGCAGNDRKHLRVDPDLAAFVPHDTVMLAGARMDEIRLTPIYRKLMTLAGDSHFDEFARRTGFDPRKDVRTILFASDGAKTVVVARGRFRTGGVTAGRITNYKGFKIAGSPHGAFAIVNKEIALAGTPGSVQAAIDRHKGGGARPAILGRAESMAGESQIWAISLGWSEALADTIPKNGNAANLKRFLQALEESTFSANLQTGLRAVATGNCRTEQDAGIMTDTLRGFVGLGRLNVPNDRPELLRVFDGIRVEREGKAVRIKMDIAPEPLDTLLEMGRKAAGGSATFALP